MNTQSNSGKFMSQAFQTYSIPAESFSDAQQSKLATLFFSYVPEDLKLPSERDSLGAEELATRKEELINYLCTKLFDGLTGTSIVYFTLGEILDAEETVVQRDILTGKVYSVLADPEYGLLTGQCLISPPIIGILRDENGDPTGSVILESGRHRTSGIVTIFTQYGLDEEDILDVEIPCFSLDADIKRVVSSNKTRGCTKQEETAIKLSAHGVDVRNPVAVWQEFLSGNLPGTPTKQRSDAFRVVFVLTTQEYDELTEDTRGAIAVSLLGSLKDNFSKSYKLMLADNHFLTRLLEFAKRILPRAITIAREEVGVTNMARSYKTVAGIISQQLSNTIKTGKLYDGTEFDISIPVPKTSAVTTTKTTAARKGKKVAPVEPQEIPQQVVPGDGEAAKAKTTRKAVAKKSIKVDKEDVTA